MFPVLWQGDRKYLKRLAELKCPKHVPWDFIAAHEKQCLSNHGQTPQRLADRGGLSPAEMVGVVEGLSWNDICRMPVDEEVGRLRTLLNMYDVRIATQLVRPFGQDVPTRVELDSLETLMKAQQGSFASATEMAHSRATYEFALTTMAPTLINAARRLLDVEERLDAAEKALREVRDEKAG